MSRYNEDNDEGNHHGHHKTRTDAEISAVIAGVDAGHRMAFHEPDDFDRDLARRQLRGDISPDEAVAAAVAKVRSDHNL